VRLGEMRERPNRHAWKACVGQPTMGSNPILSAGPSLLVRSRRARSGRLQRFSEQTLTPSTWAQADPPGCGSGAVGGGADGAGCGSLGSGGG
jgi:hypothetical protein